MRILLLVILCLIGAFSARADAASCYGLEELKAEQLLRFHSKLMVITVSCRYSSTGQELTPAYTGFTQKNLAEIRQAEHTLIAFYKKNYGGDGVSRLDKLRTLLGNEYGQQMAQVSAPTFCAQHRDEVVTFASAQPAVVYGEAESTSVSAHSYEPVCSSAKPSRARG